MSQYLHSWSNFYSAFQRNNKQKKKLLSCSGNIYCYGVQLSIWASCSNGGRRVGPKPFLIVNKNDGIYNVMVKILSSTLHQSLVLRCISWYNWAPFKFREINFQNNQLFCKLGKNKKKVVTTPPNELLNSHLAHYASIVEPTPGSHYLLHIWSSSSSSHASTSTILI